MKYILLKVLKILSCLKLYKFFLKVFEFSTNFLSPLLSLPLSTVSDLKGPYAASFVFYMIIFRECV